MDSSRCERRAVPLGNERAHVVTGRQPLRYARACSQLPKLNSSFETPKKLKETNDQGHGRLKVFKVLILYPVWATTVTAIYLDGAS